MKGKINIYDNQGNIIHSIQSIITVTPQNGYVTISYLNQNNQTMMIQTNMQYIYWQD